MTNNTTEVDLTQAPAGLVLCARIFEVGAGCGGYSNIFDPSYCGESSYGREGAYGDDDDRALTAWVMWHPDASPVCDAYRLQFSGNQ